MSKGYQKIPGVRLKFRTFHHDGEGALWASAAIWNSAECLCEIATLRLGTIEEPCDPKLYHAWVDAVSAIFHAELSDALGVPGIVGKRQAPNYKGE